MKFIYLVDPFLLIIALILNLPIYLWPGKAEKIYTEILHVHYTASMTTP